MTSAEPHNSIIVNCLQVQIVKAVVSRFLLNIF